MDWANEQHHGQLSRYGTCTSKKMEETKFEELTIKLGYPYVYTHQGNCEHLLVFRDLRYSFYTYRRDFVCHNDESFAGAGCRGCIKNGNPTLACRCASGCMNVSS